MNYNISYHDMLTSDNNNTTDSITLYGNITILRILQKITHSSHSDQRLLDRFNS